jgi:Zn-dependent peptidase ImmA (M78 family)
MKEDIFSKLHYHSGLVAQGCWDELDEYDREAIMRFGDLIVKECTEVARRTILSGSGVDPDTFTGTVTTVQEIKRHFGITE